MVNFDKVGPVLVSQLSQSTSTDDRFSVFIHTHQAPTADEAELLRSYGVNVPATWPMTVFRAEVTRTIIGFLTNLHFVKLVNGSVPMRPTSGACGT